MKQLIDVLDLKKNNVKKAQIPASELFEKLQLRTAKVAVIGLGYVGLPLAVALSNASFSVTGIDLSEEKVSKINKGINFIGDVDDAMLEELTKKGALKASSNFKSLNTADVIVICVPTPIDNSKNPDLSFIISATEQVAKYIKKGQLVILESTTYPGTTEELIQPMLELCGLSVGEDIFLAFSPERVDPGNKKFTIANTPKVVGGVTAECGRLAEKFYSTIANEIVKVSSPKVAETTKLFENVFRNVNIALVNEMSTLCHKMKISMWEVLDAAATKPFGFTKFTPGPGIGGHCIPIDPYYLSAKAKELDFQTRFIELSGGINEHMPYYVVDLITESLNNYGKALNSSKVLILGVTYKKDIEDLRESPALKIISTLIKKGAQVEFNDPYVKELLIIEKTLQSVAVDKVSLSGADCVVIVTDHSIYNYKEIVESSKIVVDTRNATEQVETNREKIIRF